MAPHKTCQVCGQPAVLEMQVCRRCGYVYPANPHQAVQYGRPLSAASQRELASAAPAVNRQGTHAGVVAGLLLLLIALIAGGVLFLVKRAATNITLPPTNVTDRRGAPANPGIQNPMSGLFVEKEGKSEIPRLTITNDTSDTIHLLLKDRTGKLFHVNAEAYETATADIPAGQYDLVITGDDPTIPDNSGDALFRSYKEYSATFILSHGPNDPIHLGE